MFSWVAGEMSHTTQGDAKKFVIVLRSSPKIIVPPAKGHEEVCGSRLEAPYGMSQRHVMAWPGSSMACGMLRSLGLLMGLCSNSLVKRQNKGGKDTS